MSRYRQPTYEFLELLQAHARWLRSDGDEGQRLVLRGADLTRADLSGADLRKARFDGSNLGDVELTGSKLEGVRGLSP